MFPSPRNADTLVQLARRYSVAPLLACGTVAVALLVARKVYSGGRGYGFLPFNLFLAFVPYAAAVWTDLEHRRRPLSRAALLAPGAIWLLFLPNAPYIATDLIHLSRVRPPVPLWYDAVLVSAFAATGCLFAVISLRLMQRCVEDLAGRAAAWAFTAAAIGLCGVGIYIGRVLRWHSWHPLTRPGRVWGTMLDVLGNPLSHWPAMAASLIFSGFVLSCYLAYIFIAKPQQSQQFYLEAGDQVQDMQR